MVIKEKQFTIAWYEDNKHLYHVWDTTVTDILENLDIFWGLTITRGKKHSFLGVDIKLTNDGKLKFGTQDQLQEAIDSFSE